MTEAERLLQSFHAKSNLLISQMDDMEIVEHDQDISSDEENQNTPRNSRKRFILLPGINVRFSFVVESLNMLGQFLNYKQLMQFSQFIKLLPRYCGPFYSSIFSLFE